MTDHDELPLPDYDHLQGGALASRIRTLDAAGVQTLLQYERSHANRIQVVSLLQHRLTSLEKSAQPADGDPSSDGDPTDPAEPR